MLCIYKFHKPTVLHIYCHRYDSILQTLLRRQLRFFNSNTERHYLTPLIQDFLLKSHKQNCQETTRERDSIW